MGGEIAFLFPLENGLHARPAGALVEETGKFACRIRFENKRSGVAADARSILELMATDTRCGDPCLLAMDGADAPRAETHLAAWITQTLARLDDELMPPAMTENHLPAPLRRSGQRALAGIPASPGTARAPVFHLGVPVWPEEAPESGRFDAADEEQLLMECLRRLDDALVERIRGVGTGAARGILSAHRCLLADPVFLDRIQQTLHHRKCSAARAVRRIALDWEASLQQSQNPLLRERALDVRDVAGQLVGLLGGAGPLLPALTQGPVVVVAETMTPAEVLSLDRAFCAGIALEKSGAHSHAAILARSFGIPCATGFGAELRSLSEGAEVILDGTRGLLIIGPTDLSRRWYALDERKTRTVTTRRDVLKNEPGRTLDGVRIEILSNAGSVEEVEAGVDAGAEGVGLFRTEFLFFEGDEPPGEERQVGLYQRAVRAGGDRPIIFRTADIGGDKPLPWLHLAHEENPQLGRRGVRLYAGQEDLLRKQLRAILRAAVEGDVCLMIPMVSSLSEIRRVREILREERANLKAAGVPAGEAELGIMIEIPSASMHAQALAAEAEFFSVGTNDLLQYFTAADRGNPAVAGQYDSLHPAFLRLLRMAVDGAHRAGRRIGICGEMAGETVLLPILIGIGFDSLSMAPARVPAVKEELRALDASACRRLYDEAAACAASEDVKSLLRAFRLKACGGEITGPELVIIGSEAISREEAIKELVDALDLGGRLDDADAVEAAAWAREDIHSTAIGFGVALPHAKSAAVRSACVACARLRRGVDWGAADGVLVDLVVMIIVPTEGGRDNLKFLAQLSRRMVHEDFRARLRAASSPAEISAILSEALQAV